MFHLPRAFLLLIFASITAEELHWIDDHEFLLRFPQSCDFPIITSDGLTSIQNLSFLHPVILRNVTSPWTAFLLWQKQALIDRYGDRLIRAGSESSIVYSAGHAEFNVKFRDLLHSLSNASSSATFVFDTTIFEAIPELKADFIVPSTFSDWDSVQNEAQRLMWHMLSLGPSRYGLPFHNHGQTWLAVVHGKKYWFVYPPGFSGPGIVDGMFSPLTSAYDWYSTIYPQLLASTQSKAPLLNYANGMETTSFAGYRPLECMQQAGDVLYLPPMWSHMTMNIGETIAIGGQQFLSEEERYNIALRNYRGKESSYDTLKDLALATYSRAQSLGNELKSRLLPELGDPTLLTSNLIAISSLQELRSLMQSTLDTTILLFRHSADKESLQYFHNLATTMLNHHEEDLDFVYLDLDDTQINMGELEMSSCSLYPAFHKDNSACTSNLILQLPLMAYYSGLSEAYYRHYFDGEDKATHETYLPSVLKLPSITSHPATMWESVLMMWMNSYQSTRGSLYSGVTVKMKLEATKSLFLIEQALQLRAVQPELHYFLSNVGSIIPVWDVLENSLIQAEELYDKERAKVSHNRATLASLYYKLAQAYEQYNHKDQVARLLMKSINSLGSFVPSLLDMLRMYVANHTVAPSDRISQWSEQVKALYRKGLLGKDAHAVEEIFASMHEDL